MSESRPMVAVLSGPTASGKSGLALALAERLDATIINADAIQLYADLRVLTARPSADEEAQAPHRLFGVLPAQEAANAASYASRAKLAIAETIATGRLPLLVGGTGLYVEALLKGLALLPDIASDIREAVRALSATDAADALAREDPAAAARLRPTDTSRLHRALEVVRSTGRSIASWQAERSGGIGASHDVRGIILMPPRERLHAAADARLDAMLADGALDEVARLAAMRLPTDLPIIRALGVRPLMAYLAGDSSLEDARAATLHATRQYQKRQSTWARSRMAGWHVLSSPDVDPAVRVIKEAKVIY